MATFGGKTSGASVGGGRRHHHRRMHELLLSFFPSRHGEVKLTRRSEMQYESTTPDHAQNQK